MKRPAEARSLVVDTNVARSASASQHPTSDACRSVLETMVANQHKVVLTATQYREWQKHQSKFTKNWLARMASKKLWHVLNPEPDSGLTDRIHALDCTVRLRKEMLKDVHLLENALATDDVVLSMETNVLKLFTDYSQPLQLPRPVAWVNPADNASACIAWMEAGAAVAQARCIPAGA